MNDVVIIGGGASPIDRGWGPRIDEHEHVVRMYDCRWQPEDDYGRYYTEGVLMINEGPSYHGWGKGTDPRPLNEWWGVVSIAKFNPLRQHFIDRLPPNEKLRIIDLTHLSDLSRKITKDAPKRVIQARGVLGAVAAIKILAPERLILVGFDNLAAGKVTRSAHYPVNSDRMNRRQIGRFDALADAWLLDHVAREHGVRLAHATEIWD